ncbi:MAG: sortase [Candidatus Gracilibacteria bacterium]|nr:sortase [Candidatus Gracilibacteria bacterium]
MVKRIFTVKIKFIENKINTQKNEAILENIEKKSENISENIKTNIKTNIKIKSNFLKQFINTSLFGIKYILTSITIFGVLLISSNFSAYSNIVESYIFEDQNKETASSLLNSVNAGEIKEKDIIYKKTKSEKIEEFKQKTKKVEKIKNTFSIKQIISSSEKKDIDLGINIVPYENRIVIPKIGKNIPLIDIKETTVESKNKFDNILMKELEGGVVRYPGSARPGEKGNSFIFGHSSNFPWISGNYNDVFARLGQVEVGDIIYSYYGQKKYKYIIKEKKVVKPTDIGVLKNDQNKKELTLMTCWPIGTTLNRLILTAELIEQ